MSCRCSANPAAARGRRQLFEVHTAPYAASAAPAAAPDYADQGITDDDIPF